MTDMRITSNLIGTAAFSGKATAQLDRCSVTFVLPDGDERDGDSQTSIQLKKQDGKAIAGEDNVAPGQHMKDPGTYGPYNLRCRLRSTRRPTRLVSAR